MGRESLNPLEAAGAQAPPIELVYDDECPVCRAYCTRIELKNPQRPLVLIDARKGGALMEEITARGWISTRGWSLKSGMICITAAARSMFFHSIQNPPGSWGG